MAIISGSFILDACAILAWLHRERTAVARVRKLLDAAGQHDCRVSINIVNLGEVFYICAKARNIAYAAQVLDALRSRIETISADDALVMFAAKLKAQYRISYANAFAAATAMMLHEPLVTGDPELKAVAREEKLELEWVGSEPNP